MMGFRRCAGVLWGDGIMKKLTMAALVAAQIAGAVPGAAAELDGRGAFLDGQRGAFAGVRLTARSGAGAPDLRAALALAPTVHSRRGADARMSIVEGLELGFSPRAKPELTLAGQRLDRMSLLGEKAPQDRANMSTLAKVAIVAGVVVVVGAIAWAHVLSEASCFHGGGDDDC
jgi:hypothetical protein